MNEWLRRPRCGCDRRPETQERPAHQGERPALPPDSCCAPAPSCPSAPGGCYLMQRILASGRMHRRRACYPLCLCDLPDVARPPFTVTEANVCGVPAWEEAPGSRPGACRLRVTAPLAVRLRDGCGRAYVISSPLEETLCLSAREPARLCWRGQAFVQCAVRLAGRPCPCDGSPCQVPLEVLMEGYILAPCTLGHPDAAPCPPSRPWYPQPMTDWY